MSLRAATSCQKLGRPFHTAWKSGSRSRTSAGSGAPVAPAGTAARGRPRGPEGPRRGRTGLGFATPSRCLQAPGHILPHGARVGPAPPPFTVATVFPLVPLLSCLISARTDRPKPKQGPSSSGRPPGRKNTRGAFGKLPTKSRAHSTVLVAIKLFCLPERHQPREAWQLAISANFAPRLAGE